MNRALVLSMLLAAGGTTMALAQATQQAAPTPLDPANLTGKVTTSPSTDVRVNRITFEPSARTNWHSHAGGQVILVEQGVLRAQERGGAGKEFKARETYVTGPNVVHWHGAVPGVQLTQVAFSFGMTTWAEKVTDEQYAAAGKR
jgi:quercetin dioxygenase-like cupin family protein